MSPALIVTIVALALLIAAGVVISLLCDRLDAERRQTRRWRHECEFWQQRVQRGVWHTCRCGKGTTHVG